MLPLNLITLTGRHYCHPKYRIARSCGSLPGQSSPAAAAGHREAKSSRRIRPTELQLEPLLSLLLQTLLVQSLCHGCSLSLYPATAIADISGAKHVLWLLPKFVASYCYCRCYWCTVYAMAATSACNQLIVLQTTSSYKVCDGC